MQIIKDDMIINNSMIVKSMTENEKVQSICQQLQNICTISQTLLTPNLKQKRIRKYKVLKKVCKNCFSEKETNEIKPSDTNLNYSEVSQHQLEDKIALISELQQQIQQIKLTMLSIQKA